MTASAESSMEVRGLTKLFPVERGFRLFDEKRLIHAVEDVSFTLRQGQIVALVGESGSGKSTIARLLARLYPATKGEAIFHGRDALKLRGKELLRYRGQVQMVFQDPFGSLNPVRTIGHQLERPIVIQHQASGHVSTRERVYELLRTVGLIPPEVIANALPHELSGGQRQRVALARALAVNPEVILADEPISMLDVSIRMGVLNLLGDLRDQKGVSFLYITHDLASARYLADETLVLYAGQVMESAPSEDLMSEPLHPYTRLLLAAVPDPRKSLEKRRVDARGEILTIVNPKPGCRFAGRCPHVMPVCRTTTPALLQPRSGHQVRCHLYDPATQSPQPVGSTSAPGHTVPTA